MKNWNTQKKLKELKLGKISMWYKDVKDKS